MNNFREWLSDNLRYILLIIGIILVLIGLFFGIRFLTSSLRGNSSSQNYNSDTVIAAEDITEAASSSSTVETTPTATVKPTAAPTGTAAAPDSAVSSVSTASESSTAETESSVSDAAENPEALKTDAYPEVNSLISTYYAGLQNHNVEAVRSTVDTLSDEDASSVANGSSVVYTDIKVYTKPGYDDQGLVVYAYYHYQTEGASALPGLSRLYLIRNSDGTYRIMTSSADDALAAYLNTVNESADVKALVAGVQSEYDSAVAAQNG